MCVCVLDLRQTEWHKLKVMGWRNINNVNINQKSKCCSNMDKYILKSVGENHGHFIMKKNGNLLRVYSNTKCTCAEQQSVKIHKNTS